MTSMTRAPLAPALAFILSCGLPFGVLAEPPAREPQPELAFVPVEQAGDDISQQERAAMDEATKRARTAFPFVKAGGHPLFRWPTRPARGYWWTRFSWSGYFVDHDSALPNRLRDYSCGTRTYDSASVGNHAGTDIGNFPDRWNMMAARQVEVVAAAAGTIIDRVDGNFDQNCGPLKPGAIANRIIVRHDDGSTARYLHLKSGTLTEKSAGERVQAGEYLGAVGSSGISGGPHLHFEVHDADDRLIDPFAGSCNPTTSDSWWESQPPYAQTMISALSTASAPPVQETCADGVMQTPGTRNEKLAFAPGNEIHFLASVENPAAGQSLTFRVKRPDGSVWKTVTYTLTVPVIDGVPVSVLAGTYRYPPGNLEANAMLGTWTFDVELGGQAQSASFFVTADGSMPTNYTDLWWNPSESGWGVNLNHQGDTIFATWFTYDTDGKGMWLVMSDGRRQADGSYSGAIYRTTGVAFSQISAHAAALTTTQVGSGTLRFASRNQGSFAYTVNGTSQEKSIQRQSFAGSTACMPAATSRASATNYQDLWWNPAESGWGVNLTHQGETIFATWFTYDSQGRGQWLVASAAQRQPTGEFSGPLYRTAGRPFSQIAGSAATTSVSSVGDVAFVFSDGENGRMTYRLDGVAQSKPITRQQFGGTRPLCR